jgi:hypothetical protein
MCFAERIDSDMRAYVSAYTEKKTALTAADRKRTGNLMVRPRTTGVVEACTD